MDREAVAATLTAALLQKLDLPPAKTRRPGQALTGDEATSLARTAVVLYETILGMLPQSAPAH